MFGISVHIYLNDLCLYLICVKKIFRIGFNHGSSPCMQTFFLLLLVLVNYASNFQKCSSM